MDGENLDFGRGIGQENPVMDLLDFPGLVVFPKADSPRIIGRIGTQGFGVVVGVELEIGITGLVDGEGSNEVQGGATHRFQGQVLGLPQPE